MRNNIYLQSSAQIEILLGKTENFDELMAAAAAEREVRSEPEETSWVGREVMLEIRMGCYFCELLFTAALPLDTKLWIGTKAGGSLVTLRHHELFV